MTNWLGCRVYRISYLGEKEAKEVKRGLFVAVIMLLVVALFVMGCPAPAPPAPAPPTPAPPKPAPPAEMILKIGTGPIGGYWFPGGAVLSQIITEFVPGVSAAPTLGGAVSNARDTNSGKMQIGYTYNTMAKDGWLGRDPFKEKMVNMRYMHNMYITPMHIITIKALNLKAIEDLKGHDFSPGKKGWGGETSFRRILTESGMSYDDLGKCTFTGYADGALLMKDKHIDFYALATMCPSANFLDVAVSEPLWIIGGSDALIDLMKEKYGMAEFTIPADTYPGTDIDVRCSAMSAHWIVNVDVPEDVVYQIVKASYENYERYHSVQSGLKEYVLPEKFLLGASCPLHKGAYKFFKEVGLEIPKEAMPVD